MSSSGRKHWKLQEFIAHSANVNCLSLGRKSGRVMVTGGDDKKVNLWAVGKPNCILSLIGHTTPVECVRFDPREVMVCAGSMSGALKVWDLEAVKIIRTLTGHKANVRCLDFHPYGDFIVSGSLDTGIKLWDIRRKGCIYTYKGHSKTVNTLKFSPDGKWVASGGDDGSVKLWDLSAGKLLTEFAGHSLSVSDVEFHPNEFLLASGSLDRTVNFWDLETFQLVSTTEGDTTPVRCIYFHGNGTCLLSGSQDILKVYSWEPCSAQDSVITGWGKVSDIVMSQKQLISGSFSMNSVSVHVVQVDKLKPFCDIDNVADDYIPQTCISTVNHVRKNFEKDTPNTIRSSVNMKMVEEPVNPDDDIENDNVEIEKIEDVNPDQIFNPRSELCRTPPSNDPFPAPLDGSEFSENRKQFFIEKIEKEEISTSIEDSTFSVIEVPEKLVTSTPYPSSRIAVRNTSNSVVSHSMIPTCQSSVSSFGYQKTSPEILQSPRRHEPDVLKYSKPIEKATALRRPNAYPPEAVSIVRPTTYIPERDTQPQRAVVYPEPIKPKIDAPVFVPEQREKPVGLEVEDFLPRRLQETLRLGGQLQPEMSEAEAMNAICRENQPILSVFGHRIKKLQIILAQWKSRDHKLAVETAVHMGDQAILVDILNILLLKSSLWSLDICQLLLPSVQELIQSKYEVYMQAGCETLKLILKNFGSLIKTNVTAPPSIGVDLSREERFNKCNSCYEHLLSIRSFLLKRQTMQGRLGQSFRELQLLMQTLE